MSNNIEDAEISKELEWSDLNDEQKRALLSKSNIKDSIKKTAEVAPSTIKFALVFAAAGYVYAWYKRTSKMPAVLIGALLGSVIGASYATLKYEVMPEQKKDTVKEEVKQDFQASGKINNKKTKKQKKY